MANFAERYLGVGTRNDCQERVGVQFIEETGGAAGSARPESGWPGWQGRTNLQRVVWLLELGNILLAVHLQLLATHQEDGPLAEVGHPIGESL